MISKKKREFNFKRLLKFLQQKKSITRTEVIFGQQKSSLIIDRRVVSKIIFSYHPQVTTNFYNLFDSFIQIF